jgi:hypothetical protein
MRRTRLVVEVFAVAVLGCGGRTVAVGDASESGASETSTNDSLAESESESSEPDLPEDPPTPCESGADVLDECSADVIGFACYDTPVPDICDGLTSGPGQLGLSTGLAACGYVGEPGLAGRRRIPYEHGPVITCPRPGWLVASVDRVWAAITDDGNVGRGACKSRARRTP